MRQAGSYVGPDKLRFDFTHGTRMTAEELRDVEDEVNRRILENQPVRALSTTLDEARSLGAMALFGEKYGDVVRMVEVGDGSWSRELCGGTHVRSTAEIGVFKLTSETSSAAGAAAAPDLSFFSASRRARSASPADSAVLSTGTRSAAAVSASTCGRRAPTWGRTSCVSTSPTVAR